MKRSTHPESEIQKTFRAVSDTFSQVKSRVHEEPVVVTRSLEHLGLPTEAPTLYAPRAPPQAELFEASCPPANDEFSQPSFD